MSVKITTIQNEFQILTALKGRKLSKGKYKLLTKYKRVLMV